MKIALYLFEKKNERQALAKQLGINNVVMNLPRNQGFLENILPWDFIPLLRMKKYFEDDGFVVSVIEDAPPMEKAKLGLPGRDDEIDQFCHLIENMGKMGINIICYNWMVKLGWLRTSTAKRTRGNALVTAFDYGQIKDAPLTEVGKVSEEQLWESFTYFLKRVIPVAEKAKVKLALHPDDPPISPIRGIARIFRGVDAIKRAMEIVPSECNGITFCQGTISAMGADVPETIRYFGKQKKIHFVHFRNIRGTANQFEETFHDDGQIDMFEAIRAYKEVNFDGPMRPDHVPTMEGEENSCPGYQTLGALFAVGYMRGLIEAVEHDRV